MKKEVKKVGTGRASFIHKLRADGVQKKEAFAKAKDRFPVSKSLFDRIWTRKAHGANGEEAKTAPKVAKTAKVNKPSKDAPIL